MMTFFAPPSTCERAFVASVKTPVDSITMSTPRLPQGREVQLVTRLERDGLVDRRPDPTDGRAVLVHITDSGRKTGQARHEDRGRHLIPLIAQLTPAERQAIAAALPALTRLGPV